MHALGLQFGSTVVSEPLIETRSLSLNSMIAYIFLPPCYLAAHSNIEDKGTERCGMSSHQPLVRTGHLTRLSIQAYEH